MASHRLQRAVRGALSISAVVLAVSLFPVPALAQPPNQPPTTESEALKQYRELSSQAGAVNETYLAAQNDLNNKRAELAKATADLAAAQQAEQEAMAAEQQFRGSVDALAGASFQGARFNNLTALLTSGSEREFLDRASALNLLASRNKEALDGFTAAVDKAAAARTQAADAQRRGQEATAAAEQIANQAAQAKTELDGRIAEAEKAYKRLSSQDVADLRGPSTQAVYLAPPGAAQAAVQTALNQVGKPYVYGAAGPNSFDCSGLTMYAYRAAGVSLPHSSRAQFGYGKAVSLDQMVAGDLLFYGGSASTIHHVGMAIGNGKMVHASTSGVPVKVVDAPRGGGSDFLGIRRIVG